jgi:hypothetical protein
MLIAVWDGLGQLAPMRRLSKSLREQESWFMLCHAAAAVARAAA